jgi:hypothetical protein
MNEDVLLNQLEDLTEKLGIFVNENPTHQWTQEPRELEHLSRPELGRHRERLLECNE